MEGTFMVGEPKSLFMVSHSDDGSSALYEVEIQPDGKVMGIIGCERRSRKRRLVLEPVAKLFDDEGVVVPDHSNLAAARFFSPSKLYLWLNQSGSETHNEHITLNTNTTSSASYGYVLDTKTKSLVPFKSPQAHKPSATVISAYGKLYLLGNPECWPEIPTPAFERYDPAINCWESLSPFPGYNHREEIKIVGYAVCYGFILITTDHLMLNDEVIKKQWAFDVTRKQWHEVRVWPPPSVYGLTNGSVYRGRAVVVGETIYTLDFSSSSVVAFKFWWNVVDGDVVFNVSSETILKGLDTKLGKKEGETEGYLVHLGNLDFCLVQNFKQRARADRQEFCITTFQVVFEGGSRRIKTLYSRICEVDTSNFIGLSYCFTPDVDDIEPKEEERVITKRFMSRLMRRKELEESKQFSLFGTSDIPQELIFDILARLSIKELIGLMRVSKAWNAAIQDPQLAKLHLQSSMKIINSSDPKFYVFSSGHGIYDPIIPVALFNHDTGGRVVKIEDKSALWRRNTNVGYCNGLLCICSSVGDDEYEDFGLWNPTINKFRKIPLSAFSKLTQKKTFHGFGYDTVNHDYKLVRFAQFEDSGSEVQVYSLNSHSWKRIQDLPAHLNRDFELTSSEGVCVDGALHWLMRLRGHEDAGRMIVVTLHLTTEEYHWFATPDRNYPCGCENFTDERKNKHREILQALGGCLCFRIQCNHWEWDAWLLKENGVAESWAKLYSSVRLCNASQPLIFSECGKMVLFSAILGYFFWYDLENGGCKGVVMSSDDDIFGRFDVLVTGQSQTLHLLRRQPELPYNYCY